MRNSALGRMCKWNCEFAAKVYSSPRTANAPMAFKRAADREVLDALDAALEYRLLVRRAGDDETVQS